MDKTTQRIVDYATTLRFDDLPATTVHQAKRVLVDTLACTIGGYDSEPGAIARQLATAVRADRSATILGTRAASSLDLAAFANTVATRYLDCNDLYQTPIGGHPSDMIPAVLAAAEASGANGPEVITDIVAAYEVFGRLARLIPDALPFQRGWDSGAFTVIGAAVGAGRVLSLTPQQLAHAVSLAAVNNVPLFVIRTGHLSMWKGCSSAGSNRQAMFAVDLARSGMTGPDAPFEGKFGFWQQLLGEEVGYPTLGGEQALVIDETRFKSFPAQGHTQGPISLALELAGQVRPDAITAIKVRSYATAVTSAADPDKWDPQTRETADHSIPFLVAAALIDRTIGTASFSDARVQAADVRALMDKMTVEPDDAYTAAFPDELHSLLEVTTTDGRTLKAHTTYPKGDPHNPLSDADLNAKFERLTAGALSPSQQSAVLDHLWHFDQAASVRPLIEALAFA